MFESGTTLKDHDENRQGEALILESTTKPDGRKLYIESYGCSMNFADSEVVASIMTNMGYSTTLNYKEADVVFINTCSIRENAEQKVRNRLKEFVALKKKKPEVVIGVLGCMAERLKAKFLEEEQLVDVVVGPDAYRDLPNIINQAEEGNKIVNVLLSREETYADIAPVRLGSNGISAFVSIMRGCDNMCSFCVVPFTRGRERSRDPHSIINEIKDLVSKGYKEVTLLGQNVDSYKWSPTQPSQREGLVPTSIEGAPHPLGEGLGEGINFSQLLELAALVSPELRVRFSTSHPKDITDDVLHAIAKHHNICNYIHLPVQSGSSRVLELMNRTYDRAWYINRIEAIRRIIPNCAVSTDVITGFCTETEEDHQETLSMMEYVQYDFAYMFKYSERPGTLAAKRYADDIAEEVKQRRLNEVIDLQHKCSRIRLNNQLGKVQKVLVEGFSKKSMNDLSGRSDQNAMVVFPAIAGVNPGDYVNVIAESCTHATLIGRILD